MRQRVTFLHSPADAVDPASLKVAQTAVTGPVIKAAREDRVTLALAELPEELRQVLRDSHELYIRWAGPDAHATTSPLLSRVSPGLHLFYTPRTGAGADDPRLCSLLRKAFGPLDCSSPAASFTALPRDRFSHSAAFQYYQPLESLAAFVRYASGGLCPAADPACASRVRRLAEAGGLDVSYDAVSGALQATASWSPQEQALTVTARPGHRAEVGLLAADQLPGMEPDELALSGSLTVLGQDGGAPRPAPVAFAFPSRHRRAEGGAAFSARFLDPAGLHPTLQLRLGSAAPPPPAAEGRARCAPHVYLTLPRAVFADRHQLADPLLLASRNLTALRHASQPVDLEAPEYAAGPWGSAVLLELAPPPAPAAGAAGGPWTAEVPLHLRYLAPAAGGYRRAGVPYPAVFWACTAEEGARFASNPFDRDHLGYDGLFGPRTVFWHVDPQPEEGARLISEVRVPVLDLDRSAWVGAGTAAVVLLGFAWVAWKLLSVYLVSGYGGASSARRRGADTKKEQ